MLETWERKCKLINLLVFFGFFKMFIYVMLL